MFQSNTHKLKLDKLQHIDPAVTETINSWVSKMSLCMLLVASSLLFYRTNIGTQPLSIFFTKMCSIVLILTVCFISYVSTVEFIYIMNWILDNYHEIKPLLYTKSMIIQAKNSYTFTAIVLIITNIVIALLMLLYAKKNFIKQVDL
jgi:hypothetical protein